MRRLKHNNQVGPKRIWPLEQKDTFYKSVSFYNSEILLLATFIGNPWIRALPSLSFAEVFTLRVL